MCPAVCHVSRDCWQPPAAPTQSGLLRVRLVSAPPHGREHADCGAGPTASHTPGSQLAHTQQRTQEVCPAERAGYCRAKGGTTTPQHIQHLPAVDTHTHTHALTPPCCSTPSGSINQQSSTQHCRRLLSLPPPLPHHSAPSLLARPKTLAGPGSLAATTPAGRPLARLAGRAAAAWALAAA